MNRTEISNEPEIDLLDLINKIWKKKYFILSTTIIFALFSLVYSLSLTNVYTSSALLGSKDKSESLTNKMLNYSSFASVAGINLPSSNNDQKKEAIARIKSYDFFIEQFIPNIKFENLVAVKSWDRTSNKIFYDKKLYDEVTDKLISQNRPSHQEAYRVYRESLVITEDKLGLFTSIKIDHISPIIAKKWVELIVEKINHSMRMNDKNLSLKSVDFLSTQLSKTSISEIKLVINNLMEEEMQKLMLIEATDDYVFSFIESPIAPEKKSKPSRMLICIFGNLFRFSNCSNNSLTFKKKSKRVEKFK